MSTCDGQDDAAGRHLGHDAMQVCHGDLTLVIRLQFAIRTAPTMSAAISRVVKKKSGECFKAGSEFTAIPPEFRRNRRFDDFRTPLTAHRSAHVRTGAIADTYPAIHARTTARQPTAKVPPGGTAQWVCRRVQSRVLSGGQVGKVRHLRVGINSFPGASRGGFSAAS
jgi:hypothetical protein